MGGGTAVKLKVAKFRRVSCSSRQTAISENYNIQSRLGGRETRRKPIFRGPPACCAVDTPWSGFNESVEILDLCARHRSGWTGRLSLVVCSLAFIVNAFARNGLEPHFVHTHRLVVVGAVKDAAPVCQEFV